MTKPWLEKVWSWCIKKEMCRKGTPPFIFISVLNLSIIIDLTSLPQNQHDISISDLRTCVANITQTRK